MLGEKMGSYTILGMVSTGKGQPKKFRCQCDCGLVRVVADPHADAEQCDHIDARTLSDQTTPNRRRASH